MPEETSGRYEFTITLCGYGKTLAVAWADAVESFSLDPGVPETHNYTFEPVEF